GPALRWSCAVRGPRSWPLGRISRRPMSWDGPPSRFPRARFGVQATTPSCSSRRTRRPRPSHHSSFRFTWSASATRPGTSRDGSARRVLHCRRMKVRLDLRKLERVVVAVALTLRLSTLAFACIRSLGLLTKLFGPIPTIAEGQGSTLSIWYLCFTLVLSSALLLAVAIGKRREGAPFAVHWLVLAGAVFVVLLDAFTSMHDLIDWAVLS